MYVNGMGFRVIEYVSGDPTRRVSGVHNTMIVDWVKKVGEMLPDYYNPAQIPEVGELNELETFVGSKKTRSGSGR